MGKKLNVVVIGGSAAGPTAASTVRRRDSEAEIFLLEKGEYISYGA
jgi:flavin-dependent dehydrogenase